MQQYFSNQTCPTPGECFALEASDTHHLFTVMRAQAGQKVQVVFAAQTLTLAEVNADQETLTYLETLDRTVELPLDVTIAVGLPKQDKLEFMAQKTTELGARKLIAYPAQWSVTKLDAKKAVKKVERLAKIAKGAAEQSKRLLIPEVTILDTFKGLTDQFDAYDHVLIAYEETAKSGETAAFAQAIAQMTVGQKLLVIFGPEGGISPQEINQMTQLGAIKVGLGPRIMRAETAPLYVLSAISYAKELLS